MEFVNGFRMTSLFYEMENKKCSKPPTREWNGMDNADWLGMVNSWWFIGILLAVFDNSSTPKTELACCISHSSKRIRSKCKDFRPPPLQILGNCELGPSTFEADVVNPIIIPCHTQSDHLWVEFFAIPNGCHKFMGFSYHPMVCKNQIPHVYGMAIEWGHAPLCCY